MLDFKRRKEEVKTMDFEKVKGRIFKENENGDTLAEITYKYVGEDIALATHTFVDPSLRGGGVAEELVDALVTEMEVQGKKIKPVCPYVVMLFKRKPDKYGHIET